MAKTTKSIPDLREFKERKPGFPAEVRPPRIPRALARKSRAAMDELKKRAVGVDACWPDSVAEAVFYQAYLERGTKLMAMHHLEALHGRLDKEQFKVLCEDLLVVLRVCYEEIRTEDKAVRQLNEAYAEAEKQSRERPACNESRAEQED